MQVLEILLTALATALPAILTAIVVFELFRISRITQRINFLLLSMESPEALDSSINTVIGLAKVETSSKPVDKSKKAKPREIEHEEDELEGLAEEPVVIPSFDFSDDVIDESSASTGEPTETEVEREEPMAFDEIHFDEEELDDFELEIEKDGTFELKETDEEAEE